MEKHMKAYRAHRALAIFYAIVLVVVFVAIAVFIPGDGSGEVPVVGLAMMVGLFVALFCLHWFVGAGARDKKPWARLASIIIGILALFGFPVGTIIGIYLLVNAIPEWGPPRQAAPGAP
jgi:hypothetical protein